ncbi:STAS domain-containing protein [Streptomyces sp. NPDC059175]|uniref:STAS domain-containing protein n=1 Tax=unclassified Streptomyces TaxID=2593676 RepID=UPI00367BFFF9
MDSTRRPLVLALVGRINPADIPLLCARLHAEADAESGDGPDEVVCDAARLTVADLAAVEAVARLRLTARRLGRNLTLQNAGPDLLTLLHLAGLT